MAWRSIFANLHTNAFNQQLIQNQPLTQPHEQNNTSVAHPFLANDQPFLHLVELLYLPIDFRRSNSYPAGIKHCVGATEDNHAILICEFTPIAVPPDVRENVEIGFSVL